MSPPPARRRRLSPEERTAELLDTAMRIVAETGDLDAASLERVAEAAGCSRNLAYRYFGHHDGLVDAMATRLQGEVVIAMAELPPDTPLRMWLDRVIEVLLDQARANGAVLLALFERPGGQLDRRQRQVLVGVLVERLRHDGMPSARARVVAPILGAALIGGLGAAVNGAPRRAVTAELDRVLDALVG